MSGRFTSDRREAEGRKDAAQPVRRRAFAIGPATAPEEADARSTAERLLDGPAPAGAGSGASTPAGGQPLDPGSRSYFESRFGEDLSSVRVHADARAAYTARQLGASAFTVGDDIGFAAGAYAPGTLGARRLLAHELAHVVEARHDAGPPVLRRECDPTRQSCPEPPMCRAEPEDFLLPIEGDAGPADLSLDIAVSGPPSLGSAATRGVEHLRMSNPVLSWQREDYYLVPIQEVFATPEEAATPMCRQPPAGAEGATPAWPFTPAAPSTPAAPFTPAAPYAPGFFGAFARPAFQPGQTVYALDGPLTVVAATADYVVTSVYTKFAVGAGSMTLVLTENGHVLVDAGMHQVGGNINDILADAAVQRLADALGGEPLTEVMLTHLHADHTALLPRIYARWEIGTLRLNALQALMPSSTGTGTRLDDLARSMIAARRDRVSAEVRAELTSGFGPWDLLVDATEREAQLAAAVAVETTRRMSAMRPTQVELALPSGGQVVAASMPLGSVALPPGFAFDTAPITRGMGGGGTVTILDPRAATVTGAMAGTGARPREAVVDAQSSTYVIDLPSGAQLIVVSDQRVEDLLALERAFEDQLARFGTPRRFRVWDMTHHLQVGFSRGAGIVRGQQLADLTRMLSEFIEARNRGGAVVGDALIVSVHGPGTGSGSYVDPANVWLLRSLGIEVFPATGGGSVLTAAQDMSVLEVQLDPATRVTGVAGPSYPGLSPSDFLLRRAGAAMVMLEGRIEEERERLPQVANTTDRATIQARIDSLTAERARIEAATAAYTAAFHAELTRSTRGASTARPDVAPAAGGTEPAPAAAAALRALLAGYEEPVVGEVPRFTPAALVVLGQEGRAAIDAPTRALLDARTRVVELAAGLRWTSPPERRAEVATALDAYRAQIQAAMSAHPGTRDVLARELARIDADMTALTGLSAQAWREMRQAAALAAQVERNRVRARTVESTAQLVDNTVAAEILANNDGYALVGPALYRLTRAGDAVTFSMIPLAPAGLPRSAEALPVAPPALLPASVPEPPGPVAPMVPRAGTALAPVGPIYIPGPLPPELAAWPNIINVSGRTIVFGGGTVLPPTPSEPLAGLRPGELFVRGSTSSWVVCDPITRLPIAGAARGGEVWQVEADGAHTLLVDMEGNVQARGAPRLVVRSIAETPLGKPVGTPEPVRGPSAGTRVVAGGMGLIVLANEILGPIGRVLAVQRSNIERMRAQVRFWVEFGANPVREMRTQNSDEIQPAGTAPSTSVFGDPVYDAVSAIDPAALGRALDDRIRTYQDFLLWTDLGVSLGCLAIDPPRRLGQSAAERARPRTYHAIIDGPPGTRRRARVDLTPVLAPIEQRTLEALDAEVRRTVAGWSAAERGNVYRLRRGSETRLYRLHASGWIHGSEPILSAPSILGPDPWVRVRERRGGRALCDAANADARRSALVSAYGIHKPIEDVMTEVREGGRAILGRWPESGRLEGFVAGPSPDGRLGETRYYRDPNADTRNMWTVAIGQLNWFWVDEDDLASLDDATVEAYARPR